MKRSSIASDVTWESDPASRWTNRALAASVVVIVVATTFPFEFFLQDTAFRRSAPFPFWLTLSAVDIVDFVENILLFVPFGFGLACFLWRKNLRAGTVLLFSLLLGASLSFAVELSQVFLPTRDPSWDDVAADALGAVAGCLAFYLFGIPFLSRLSRLEEKLGKILTPGGAIAGFLLVVAVGFGISVPLQKATSLGDWDSGYRLYVGNDPTGTRPWQGRVSELEFASQAVFAERATHLGGSELQLSRSDGLLASYRFSGAAPYRDVSGASPDLAWMPGAPSSDDSDGGVPTGPHWLASEAPAVRIAEAVKQTNQFTLRVVCKPQVTNAAPFGRIVSFSRDPYHVNFILSQEGANLVFGLRTPQTGREGEPALVAPNVFANGDAREITLTYDGSELLLYVNGERDPHSVKLSPGAALLRPFIRLREPDLRGYAALYDFLVFVPLGVLLALAARPESLLSCSRRPLLMAGAILPPALLEAILATVRRGSYEWQEAVLGICLLLGSAALWNLDGCGTR